MGTSSFGLSSEAVDFREIVRVGVWAVSGDKDNNA